MRTKLPSIFFALIFCAAGAFVAPKIRDAWPNTISSKADEYAGAIAAAYKLKRNGSIKYEELAHKYLDRAQTPHQISQSIADDLKNEPKEAESAPKGNKYTDEQLTEEYVQYSIPELRRVVLEIGNAKKPQLVIFVVLIALVAALFGVLLPHLLGNCWRFFLSCIHDLSLAIQGK